MNASTRKPLVSVIIPVFNKLDYTKKCIESLLQDSDRPNLEIIVVDNASTDGTKDYLKQIEIDAPKHGDSVRLILNSENKGVAPAWNQGARIASAEYLAILNNDIIVSRGWLRSLLWALEKHRLQLISPFASTGPLTYDFEIRSASFVKKNIHKLWNDYDFCAFLLPKAIYTILGPFDENFIVGGYEDTDYVYRLAKAGMKYGVTGASFIHHFGSSTLGEFKKLGDKHVPHNLNYFLEKWGEDPSDGVGSLSSKIKRGWRKLKLKLFDHM